MDHDAGAKPTQAVRPPTAQGQHGLGCGPTAHNPPQNRPQNRPPTRRPAPWRGLLITLGLGTALLLAACERTDTVQRGYRGTGMLQVYEPASVRSAMPLHEVPAPEPVDPPDPELPSVDETFENVKVLNDLTVLEFSRLMQALSTWVSPEEGCEFCHNAENLASDEKYPKVVARRMLQMTRQINTQWKSHVGDTGVTCWTCHRGQAVPSGDWFADPGPGSAQQLIGNRTGQNRAGVRTVANASLPSDPLSAYLNDDNAIRVQGTQALAGSNRHSIKQAEWSYGLMLYMSKSLGVNCMYCHNSRALASWNESSPQRATAWYGIRMVRQLNVEHLNPIGPLLPAHRLSASGDNPKVGCETCHKGAYKPLYGAKQLPDYPELAGLMKRALTEGGPLVEADVPPPKTGALPPLVAVPVDGPADVEPAYLGLPPR